MFTDLTVCFTPKTLICYMSDKMYTDSTQSHGRYNLKKLVSSTSWNVIEFFW